MLLVVCCLGVAVCGIGGGSVAEAATVVWNTDQSGDWGTASNWSPAQVPGVNDDVVIDRVGGNPTVTITGGNVAVRSVTATDNLNVSGGQLTVTGPSQVSGSFNLSNGAQLRVSGSTASFSAVGAAQINNGRFEVTGGAVVSIANATQYDTTGVVVVAATPIVRVTGAGSRLNMPSVVDLRVGRGVYNYAVMHLHEAIWLQRYSQMLCTAP